MCSKCGPCFAFYSAFCSSIVIVSGNFTEKSSFSGIGGGLCDTTAPKHSRSSCINLSQRPEDTKCEASMAYIESTCINLKEKKMEDLKQICMGSVHKIPTTGLNAKGEDSG